MSLGYWQHRTPLRCPKRHEMGWLGRAAAAPAGRDNV